jgi:hypothetical protein
MATVDWLNAREQAFVIWTAVMIVWLSIKVPSAVIDLLHLGRLAVTPPLGPLLALSLAYVTTDVLVLDRVGALYDTAIKDITVWYVAVALPLMFAAATKRDAIQTVLRRAASLAGLLTFVVGLYVFPLGIELFVVPALAFVVLTHAVAVQQKEFRDVAKLFNGFLVAFGFALLAYAATQAAGDPRRLIAAATWEQFALPIVLTLVFVPFALAVSRYARWDSDRVRRRFFATTAPD